MKIDQSRLRDLLATEPRPLSADELRREENVFFVGGNLAERQTLETLYESHYQCHASLFHLVFGDTDAFHNGELLARMIKKNFNAHLVGTIGFAAPASLIERAYAAGVDILDIPLPADPGEAELRSHSLQAARAVFPRWSVVSTLEACAAPAGATIAGIDSLLAAEVLPLVTLSGAEARLSAEDAAGVFTHLGAAWKRAKAGVKPLLPLIRLTTPLVPAAPASALRGFINAIEDRRLLATSDLRRVLRVKEVEESYASSGL